LAAAVGPTRTRPRTSTRLFSARHEFANDWFRFLHAPETATGQTLNLDLKPEHFPFNFKGQRITINQVVLCLNLKDERDPGSSAGETYLQEYPRAAALRVSLTPGSAESAGELTRSLVDCRISVYPLPSEYRPPLQHHPRQLDSWSQRATLILERFTRDYDIL
jgi:hypothetical protein